MKFGQGTYNFQARKEAFSSIEPFILNNQKQSKKIYIGLPQWGSSEWKGLFYSKQAKPKNFLNEYSQILNCVEVSSSFYTEISSHRVLEWKKEVGKDFKFLPKWNQNITHKRGLVGCKALIKDFVDTMILLEENLGSTILQLPPNFSNEFKRDLFYFLEEVPKDFPLCLEFRHSSWFSDHRVYSQLENYLAKTNRGMVCSDTPAFEALTHFSVTGEHHIIRYVSDQNEEMDKKRIHLWRDWLEREDLQGNLYFTLHRPENEFTPLLLSYFSPELKEKLERINQEDQADFFDL